MSDNQIYIFNGVSAAIISIAIYKLVVVRLGAPPVDYLPWHGAMRPLLIGIIGAAVMMSLIVGVIALLGGYKIIGWGGASSWVMILFAAGLQAAVMEEVVFRGILFSYLEQFGGSWFALAATSALFGAAHASNDGATILSSVAITLEAGIMLGAALMVTRSLWLPIGLHFGWNVTQGLVWDVPVSGFAVDGLVEAEPVGSALISGGAFGVEASIVAIVVATGVGLYLCWLAVQRSEVIRPIWMRKRPA